jgi:hypothetical protein
MKTFEQAIEAAVEINLTKRFNDVQSAYNCSVILLISKLYDLDVNNVSVIYSEALTKAKEAEDKRRKDARRAEYRADNEARRLANLAKKDAA